MYVQGMTACVRVLHMHTLACIRTLRMHMCACMVCIVLWPFQYVSCVLVQGKNSLGLMWWFLCREVLRLRGSISRALPWEVMPDLFFYRDPEEVSTQPMHPDYTTVGRVTGFCF